MNLDRHALLTNRMTSITRNLQNSFTDVFCFGATYAIGVVEFEKIRIDKNVILRDQKNRHERKQNDFEKRKNQNVDEKIFRKIDCVGHCQFERRKRRKFHHFQIFLK